MKLLLITFSMLISLFSWEQEEFITNGSFEEIDSCYGAFSPLGVDAFHLSGCDGWTCPTYASSDLWCVNPFFQNNQPPQNGGTIGGFQYPMTGNNMSGIYVFTYNPTDYREYIQNELAFTLSENQYYELTFYVNCSWSGNYSSCMQAYFSKTPLINSTSYDVFNVVPQVKNDTLNYIKDTLDWVKLSFLYKAQGGEKYLTIGCFDDYANINLTIKDTNDLNIGDVYFFIDDVSLTKAKEQVSFPNVFTPNGDGVNDYFYPTIINVSGWCCFIYNRWGNLVYTLDSSNNKWDGKVNGKNIDDGVYYYIMESSNPKINESGFLTKLSNQ